MRLSFQEKCTVIRQVSLLRAESADFGFCGPWKVVLPPQLESWLDAPTLGQSLREALLDMVGIAEVEDAAVRDIALVPSGRKARWRF